MYKQTFFNEKISLLRRTEWWGSQGRWRRWRWTGPNKGRRQRLPGEKGQMD